MAIINSKTFRVEPTIYDPVGLVNFTKIEITNYSNSEVVLNLNTGGIKIPLLPKEYLPLVYGGN